MAMRVSGKQIEHLSQNTGPDIGEVNIRHLLLHHLVSF